MKKMFGNLEFGPVNDVSLSHLGIAVRNAAGDMVSYDPLKDEIVNVDLFEFDAGNMIYAMPCALKDIKKGDVILHGNGNLVFVVNTEDGISVVDVTEGEKKEILPTKSIFGFNFVTKIVSLIDFSAVGASEESPFGNLLPLMMLKNDDTSMKNILPMMMLMGGNQGLGNLNLSNPLLLMMLMNDKGGSEGKNFFPLMMLQQMTEKNS